MVPLLNNLRLAVKRFHDPRYAARDLGYHLIILRDACQSQRPGAQDFCMNRLFPHLGRVMNVEQMIRLIWATG